MLIKESRNLVPFPETNFAVADMQKLCEPKDAICKTFYANDYGGISQCMIISDKGLVIASPESHYIILLQKGLYSFGKAKCSDVNSTEDYLAFTGGHGKNLDVKCYPFWDSALEDLKDYVSYGESALEEICRRL